MRKRKFRLRGKSSPSLRGDGWLLTRADLNRADPVIDGAVLAITELEDEFFLERLRDYGYVKFR